MVSNLVQEYNLIWVAMRFEEAIIAEWIPDSTKSMYQIVILSKLKNFDPDLMIHKDDSSII